ncbi:head GIN domain-containing protein [Archangium lansingense]|uniref:head GIN domain-containing protein n=1 Tax=Archangium lansingense TaxID=2995310 RepID=UPI003B775048
MKRNARGPWMGMSLLVVALSGCWLGPQVQGSGNLVQEERQLPGFVSLEVNDGIEATVVVDPNQPQKVRLVGDDNLVKLLRTEPLGSSGLRVYFSQEEVLGWNSRNPLRVEVTVPSLEALLGSGGGKVEVSGDVSPASFSLEVSGGGTVKMSGLDTESFSMEVSGGSDVTLAGSATRVESDMSGGSNLRARSLTSRDATLTSSGGGTTELRVSESLRVSASGGSEVRIIGRPTVLKEELSGGSTLDFE